jgi:hypothetical protein
VLLQLQQRVTLTIVQLQKQNESFQNFIKASSFPKEYSAPSTTCQEIQSKLCYRPSLNNDHLSNNPAKLILILMLYENLP